MSIENKGSISNITNRRCVDSSNSREGGLEVWKGKGGREGSQDGVGRKVNTRGDWWGGGAAEGWSGSVLSGTRFGQSQEI